MAYELVGKNFTPPDIHGKVTGKAKYAEDFAVEGMIYARLLTSPIPHASVRGLNLEKALNTEGVIAILTADDVPAMPTNTRQILTNEPAYVGDPILAVAAVDEQTAENAIQLIELEFERLPFTTDPLASLSSNGVQARTQGNVGNTALEEVRTIHWPDRDIQKSSDGIMPEGEAANEWSVGDLEAGFEQASVVLDESFVTASFSHHSMEPRSTLSYWENGKCFVYGSSQSQSFPVPSLARYIGISPADLVFIAEYCGGGFGSKGSAYPSMAIPAYLSRFTGRPVMLRITREEEYNIGSARHGFQGRLKLGFRADGRISAADIYIVQDNGANEGFTDWNSAGDALTIVYTPQAVRYRGVPVYTNTPAKGAQRGPGQNQLAVAIEPLLDKAAAQLDIDPLEIRRINAPSPDILYGRRQNPITSSYMPEAIEKGAAEFGWAEKKATSGQRDGSKVIGVGMGQAYHSAGFSGFDGLVRISTEGKLHIHTGVGNLGTYSHTATSRVAAEILKCNWDNCVVERGDSRKHLPWNIGQFGSNTSFTMTRTNYVAAMDALEKLLEIAATALGGSPEDFDIAEERVFRKSNPDDSISYAEAAVLAIQTGGKYSGETAPEDIDSMTRASVAGLAGTGLIGVAKDNLEHNGTVPALAVGFVRIELDTETGKFEILDYLGVADCGTVLHPQGLGVQIKGAANMGFGMAAFERHAYDSQNGLPASVSLHQAKIPTYLDSAPNLDWSAVDKPEPQNPVGAKGIGEPIQGCAAAALVCAISDALGGHYFNRTPITADQIVNAAKGLPQSHMPLQTNIT